MAPRTFVGIAIVNQLVLEWKRAQRRSEAAVGGLGAVALAERERCGGLLNTVGIVELVVAVRPRRVDDGPVGGRRGPNRLPVPRLSVRRAGPPTHDEVQNRR